jgi:hypothetical protein
VHWANWQGETAVCQPVESVLTKVRHVVPRPAWTSSERQSSPEGTKGPCFYMLVSICVCNTVKDQETPRFSLDC